MLEMRPLIAAEPMFRAPSPEMLDELNGASAACNMFALQSNAAIKTNICERVGSRFIRRGNACRLLINTGLQPGVGE